MTSCTSRSFETKFSYGYEPPGSERSTIMRQKSLSLISAGNAVVWTAIAGSNIGRRLVTAATIAAANSDLRKIIEPPKCGTALMGRTRWSPKMVALHLLVCLLNGRRELKRKTRKASKIFSDCQNRSRQRGDSADREVL